MSESSKITGGGKAAQRARQERRLAAALRENLKRRKAQVRGRDAAHTGPEPSAEPHDSAGIADDNQKL